MALVLNGELESCRVVALVSGGHFNYQSRSKRGSCEVLARAQSDRGGYNAGKEGREGDVSVIQTGWVSITCFYVHFGVSNQKSDGNAKMYLKNVHISSNLHVFEL